MGEKLEKVKTKSSSCDEKPGSATKEDHMKRLMEYAGKLKV
jgi:hypothetical protein